MARTTLTPKKGERGGKKRVLRSKDARKALAEKGRRPLSPIHHPSPAKESLPRREELEKQVEEAGQLEEAEKWVEEARWLEEVGRSPSLLPAQQLAQMTAEAVPIYVR